MNNADTTVPMSQPPISSSTDSRPQDTLLQRGAFDPPFTPGTLGRLDRFEILRLLGEGGMGQVFLAREPRTDARVAVKIMRPQMAGSPAATHSFLTEARHMYRLSHPRILRVLEVSDRKEGPYFVMPYVEGGSLLEQCRSGQRLPDDRILSVARQVAEALAHAHSRGLIHRDLKPGNVLLDKDGNAYLTDFGLVRTVFNDSLIDPSESHIEGTVPYMSPAVARGEAEDTRCDIYSFGALLYELLTGQPPYTGRTSQIILAQVLQGPPPPVRTVNPKANPGLVKIAEGCMARELRDRYATMADVVADLERAAKGQAPFGPHQQSQRRSSLRLAALAAAVLAVAGLAGFAVHHFSAAFTVTAKTTGVVRLASEILVQTGAPAATANETFAYTTTNGTITITKYTGPGGVVSIPDVINGLPVIGIGNGAFWDCTNVTRLTIPASVTSLAEDLSSDWHKSGRLLSVVVDAANTAYCSSADGVVFSKDKTCLVSCPNGKAGNYLIPSNVTSIRGQAFLGCHNLTQVTIPGSVTNIGNMAFAGCSSLTRMAIPASVSSLGANPFRGCSKMTSVVVEEANPSFVSAEGGVLFDKARTSILCYPGGRVGGYTIPNGVIKIGDGAFRGCFGLTSVTLPDSVSTIGEGAFHFCTNLTTIVIPHSVTNIGASAFFACNKLTAACFLGDAPSIGSGIVDWAKDTIVYYRPGTKGWGPTFGGRPTAVWNEAAVEKPGQYKIVEGEGWRGFRVGATREELIKDLGAPDADSKGQWLKWKKHSVHCIIDDKHGASELRFDDGFTGETTAGIGIGSTLKRTLAAYGAPAISEDKGRAKKLIWSSKGILIWFNDDKVSQIVVFPKK